MKKLHTILTLKKSAGKWDLFIHDRTRLVQECVEQFTRTEVEAVDLEVEIKNPFKYKTNSQLGYLHAEVWKVCYQWATDAGNEWSDQECRDQIKAHLNFVEQRTSIVDHGQYWAVKSCADSSKEEVAELIDKIIRMLGEDGYKVTTPEEYFLRMGIKMFDK